MVNDARIARGKSLIGFINPTVGPVSLFYFQLVADTGHLKKDLLDWFLREFQRCLQRNESRMWYSGIQCD